MTMLTANNLNVTLAGRPVLSDVSLSLSSGHLVALVVPNGASPVQPSAISHWQCSTKRSASGPPSSP